MSGSQKNFEENHLLPLLSQQFPDMAESYKNNLKMLVANSYSALFRCYTYDSVPVFFRFSIEQPAFFMLSEPLSRFQACKQYSIPVNDEHKFYASLGIIPVYFANLNRITCLKLWGNQAVGYFTPYSQPLRQQNESIWQFGVGTANPSEFSSLNFVLRNGADERKVPDPVRNAILTYFQYGYWSFPKKGFGSSAHVIHSRENINHVLKVTKGIYILKYIHEARKERLAPDYWGWVQRVELQGFNFRGEPVLLSVYMPVDVVKELWNEIEEEKKSNLIINGLIYDFRAKSHDESEKLRLLSVTAGFMEDNIELIKTLIGYCASEKFYTNRETLGLICTISQLESYIHYMQTPFSRKMTQTCTMLGMVDQPIQYMVDELYPMIVQKEKNLFFVHPAILGALTALGQYDFLRDRNKDILVNFISLLEQFKKSRELSVLRFTDEAEYFKKIGVDFSSLCTALRLSLKTVTLSKLLNTFF